MRRPHRPVQLSAELLGGSDARRRMISFGYRGGLSPRLLALGDQHWKIEIAVGIERAVASGGALGSIFVARRKGRDRLA